MITSAPWLLLVDDHPIVRQGLAAVITKAFPRAMVAEVGTAKDAMAQFDATDFTLVVLDLGLPDRDGLEVLMDMKKQKPQCPVLVLSIHAEDQYAIRAIRAGASGYLAKDRAPEELVAAITRVMEGGRYVTASLAERLLTSLEHPEQADLHQSLSHREFQVLKLMASGKSLTDIGDELHINPKTVSTYRFRLLEKLRLKTTADLVRYALEHHVV